MNIARNNSRETTKRNGSHDSGAGNGHASEPIFVHWGCPIPNKLPPSQARTVVVDVEATNIVGLPSLVVITPPHRTVPPRPHRDQECRELWLDDVLVKKFGQPSPNQDKILAAFEEEDWPTTIDDPLPPVAEQNAKRRLNQTVRNLNRGRKNNCIHFEGDGSGERVVWKRRIDP